MTNQDPDESFAGLELPSYRDKIPGLIEFLRRFAQELKEIVPQQSYLPYWEDLYREIHNLKGLSKLLSYPADLEEFFLKFHTLLVDATLGELRCPKPREAAVVIEELANAFQDFLDGNIGVPFFWLELFSKVHDKDSLLASTDLSSIFYKTEQVCKRWREASIFPMDRVFFQEEMELNKLPRWKESLSAVLDGGRPKFRGLQIYCVASVPPDGSSKVALKACVAQIASLQPDWEASLLAALPQAKFQKKP